MPLLLCVAMTTKSIPSQSSLYCCSLGIGPAPSSLYLEHTAAVSGYEKNSDAAVRQNLAACSPAAGTTSSALQAASAADILQKCASQLEKRFDAALGGFGGAPKFPRPCEISALLAWHALASSQGKTTQAGVPVCYVCHYTCLLSDRVCFALYKYIVYCPDLQHVQPWSCFAHHSRGPALGFCKHAYSCS